MGVVRSDHHIQDSWPEHEPVAACADARRLSCSASSDEVRDVWQPEELSMRQKSIDRSIRLAHFQLGQPLPSFKAVTLGLRAGWKPRFSENGSNTIFFLNERPVINFASISCSSGAGHKPIIRSKRVACGAYLQLTVTTDVSGHRSEGQLAQEEFRGHEPRDGESEGTMKQQQWPELLQP
ncbi:hypothetical protein RRG08_063388 [Elysia crispata]|uniref:Uncharacterized protein n=1 Tax=Elysia crispata TaxID=231223 RepID=A0AAE1B2J5_9GAST|nr:hypothetical protein RRG08_063388 [Elysia crispata]